MTRGNDIPHRSGGETFLDYMRVLADSADHKLRISEMGKRAKYLNSKRLSEFKTFGEEKGYIKVEKKGRYNIEIILLERGLDLVKEVRRIEEEYDFYFSSTVDY